MPRVRDLYCRSALIGSFAAMATAFITSPALSATSQSEADRSRGSFAFIDSVGETLPPAGYVEMCQRADSPFCEPSDVENRSGFPRDFELVRQDATSASPATGGIIGGPSAVRSVALPNASDRILLIAGVPKLNVRPVTFCHGEETCFGIRSGLRAGADGKMNPVSSTLALNIPAIEVQSLSFKLAAAGGLTTSRQLPSVAPRPDAWQIVASDHATRTAPKMDCRAGARDCTRQPLMQWQPQPDLALSTLAYRPPSSNRFRIDMDWFEPAPTPVIQNSRVDGSMPPRVAAEPAAWRKLIKAENAFVNTRTHQVTDRVRFGADERWERSYTGGGASGDCEDLAIEKRIRLIEAGFPPDRLFFATVYRPDVGLHAVLVARMDKGDYVLDSLSPFIERWDKVPYAWVSVQDAKRKDRWYSVQSPRNFAQFKPASFRIVVSG